MTLISSRDDSTDLGLESLADFDTSKTERLEISRGDLLSGYPLHQALLPTKDLRTLTLFVCNTPHIFIRALQPPRVRRMSWLCPKLDEIILVLQVYGGIFDVMALSKRRRVRRKGRNSGLLGLLMDGRGLVWTCRARGTRLERGMRSWGCIVGTRLTVILFHFSYSTQCRAFSNRNPCFDSCLRFDRPFPVGYSANSLFTF
jgi:hypothetical protein